MSEPRRPVVGITGGQGFIAWHLRGRIHALNAASALTVGRDAFSDSAMLEDFVQRCDAIVHLAGMNRGADAEVERVNVELCIRLTEACARVHRTPQIIFANSTHSGRDTPYGRAKRRGAEAFAVWAGRSGARFVNLVLPQVFGEGGRPFYNSVVATFCHQLACGETPKLVDDKELELVHAQDVAARILALVTKGGNGDVPVPGRRMMVSELLSRLNRLAETYHSHLIPPLADEFELSLFNTYRAYRFPAAYPAMLDVRLDARGALFEAVRSLHGGQCFFSTTRPGVTRGNHYHLRKFERFVVVGGRAVIRIRRLFSEDIVSYPVSAEHPCYVDMPALHTHNITNVGDGELTTLFWAHEIFDPSHSDTYVEPVQA